MLISVPKTVVNPTPNMLTNSAFRLLRYAGEAPLTKGTETLTNLGTISYHPIYRVYDTNLFKRVVIKTKIEESLT